MYHIIGKCNIHINQFELSIWMNSYWDKVCDWRDLHGSVDFIHAD